MSSVIQRDSAPTPAKTLIETTYSEGIDKPRTLVKSCVYISASATDVVEFLQQ